MPKAIIKTIIAAMLISLGAAGCSNSGKKAADNVETAADSANNIKTISLDGVKATWIGDNAEEKLMDTKLFSEASQHLIDSLALQDGVPSSVSTFLVETDGIKILFDTGLGSDASQLLSGLQSLGLEPEDISYLYLTHFHGDHIGGMLRNDSIVFPNAAVYASKVEYDAWMNMADGKNAMQVKTMEAYRDQLHLFEFGDTLPGKVVTIDAVGHTPGHTAFQTGKLLIVGDIIHGAALQIDNPNICASFDMDKPTAIKSRKRILQYAKDNHLTMAGMHFPSPAFIKSE